jgi:RNA polymerase sigma-70 factor (ECF subfamily)
MQGRDHTTMGGNREAFLTTDWSVIDQIRSGTDSPSSDVLINDLLKRYWKPVYCYLRRKGCDNERAKDLTQGFFHEVVLRRSLVEHADKSRGRFRTLLLTALQQYVAGVHRKETTQRRTPKGALVALDQLEPDEMPEAPVHLSPEESFHYAWAAQLLDQLLEEVEAKCRTEGKALHWQVFHDRVLQPIMEDVPAPSLAQVCQKHGIESASQASNMIVTVNRRFQAALKRHIRRSVVQDNDVDAEFRELIEVFARGSAR